MELLKRLIKRYWSHITGVLALVVSLYQLHGYVYQSGFDAGQAVLIKQHNAAMEKQRKEYEDKVQQALNTLAADQAADIDRLRQETIVEYRTKEVIKYVDREITVPSGCTELADDVVSLLDQATSIVIGAATSPKDTNKP